MRGFFARFLGRSRNPGFVCISVLCAAAANGPVLVSDHNVRARQRVKDGNVCSRLGGRLVLKLARVVCLPIGNVMVIVI